MSLFSPPEMDRIRREIVSGPGNVLITFRNMHGPTALRRMWMDFVAEIGAPLRCVSWWSSSGNIGLIECELENNLTVYGQWALADSNELVGVFRIDDEEIADIRDGFESGNVTSFVMRTIRIGETQDRD